MSTFSLVIFTAVLILTLTLTFALVFSLALALSLTLTLTLTLTLIGLEVLVPTSDRHPIAVDELEPRAVRDDVKLGVGTPGRTRDSTLHISTKSLHCTPIHHIWMASVAQTVIGRWYAQALTLTEL
jgi:hypothetical protein